MVKEPRTVMEPEYRPASDTLLYRSVGSPTREHDPGASSAYVPLKDW
jgi:hypothetical protein